MHLRSTINDHGPWQSPVKGRIAGWRDGRKGRGKGNIRRRKKKGFFNALFSRQKKTGKPVLPKGGLASGRRKYVRKGSKTYKKSKKKLKRDHRGQYK